MTDLGFDIVKWKEEVRKNNDVNGLSGKLFHANLVIKGVLEPELAKPEDKRHPKTEKRYAAWSAKKKAILELLAEHDVSEEKASEWTPPVFVKTDKDVVVKMKPARLNAAVRRIE